MNKERAIEILRDAIEDNGLFCLGWYLAYTNGDDKAVLDGRFTAEDLEAIAFIMKNNLKRSINENT